MFKKYILSACKQASNLVRKYSKIDTATPEKLIDVGSLKCHVEIVGNGKEPLFLISGGMGTPRSDFFPQFEHLDRNKYTLIGWSLPGIGLSTPYDVDPGVDGMHRNAEVAAQLIPKLGLGEVNVMGWCSGGNSAAILAANSPELVKKLVLIGTWVKVSPEDETQLKSREDIKTWSASDRDILVKIFGYDRLQRMSSDWGKIVTQVHRDRNGVIAVEECKRIKCPTLVVHGRNDNFVDYERHAQFHTSLIPNARLVTFDEGNHGPHLEMIDEFNSILDNFIFINKTN